VSDIGQDEANFLYEHPFDNDKVHYIAKTKREHGDSVY
jgi:hypothetical protein